MVLAEGNACIAGVGAPLLRRLCGSSCAWMQKRVPLGQEFKSERKRTPSGGRWRTKLRPAFMCSFTVQAVAAVALAHAVLMPLLLAGWLRGPGFALAALALSSMALVFVGRRWARSIAKLREALQRFGEGRDSLFRVGTDVPQRGRGVLPNEFVLVFE